MLTMLESIAILRESMPQTLTPRRELWLLLTLAGIQFTHNLDFMIMMPLGPQFTLLVAISDAQFATLVSADTLAAGVSGLLAATYIDRFGRKRLLLVLYCLFAVATLACGLAASYQALMGARIAAGIFGGVLSALSQTIVGDVIPFERRGRAMGIVMTSFSVATVAGVPSGLYLAAHLGWHASFFGIALLCGLFGLAAAWSMPVLRDHLLRPVRRSAWDGITQVLRDRNHLTAFLFSALLMFAGFTVIPFITLYLQSNLGWRADQIPATYLCGGMATLLTARYFGRLTDRVGKVRTFRVAAVLVVLPLVATTLTAGLPMWGVLLVSTAFFTLMSARMIPGMAILTSAANPDLRGTFMTLNSAVQSVAMGAAAFIGGNIITRDSHGLVQHYWVAATVGACASLATVWVAGRLDLRIPPATGRSTSTVAEHTARTT